MFHRPASSFLLACAIAAGLHAAARAEHVNGDDVAKRVDGVMKAYKWSSSIEELKARAAKEKKLIFWLQLVGELDGGL